MDSEEGNGASQHPCSLDVALRKIEELERRLNILEGKMPLMVTNTVRQEIKPEVIEPVADVLLRKVVKEELQLIEEKLGGTRNVMPKEMILRLKFLVEVSDTIQTGKVIKGINDECLQLALVDATGHVVSCGPESSARVEILLLDATSGNEYDDENELTRENFERRIIREGDKTKPHFTRSFHIHLVKGVGVLTGVKLGHDSDWTKNCNCRLGARIVQKFSGVDVRETWTAPFKVVDCRSTYYKKSERPSPSSKVWRLKKIGRAGQPCKHLKDKKIETVLDFLFWLSVNAKELQEEITKAGDKRWKTMMAHARTCKIDDKKMYHHKSSTEPHTGVIYDCVGELKGVIDESHFVPIDNLSADEKDHACKLLSLVLEPSAFVDRYNTSYNDEASLVQQYPYKPSNLNSSTICSIQQFSNGFASENINGFQTAEPGCSSQSISPNDIYDSLVSRDVVELRNHAMDSIPEPENIPTDLDDGMYGVQPSTHSEILEADPRELLVSPPNDMDPFQLNGGCQNSYGNTWNDEFSQFALSPDRMHTFAVDEYSLIEMSNAYDERAAAAVDEYIHIEMSNGDDERAAAAVVNGSIRWKQLFCVVRVLSVSVGHPPKRKKQRVG